MTWTETLKPPQGLSPKPYDLDRNPKIPKPGTLDSWLPKAVKTPELQILKPAETLQKALIDL